MISIDMYADLSCPFAYAVHWHWRQLRHEYASSIEIRHKSLALEYVNRVSTPKAGIEVELPVLLLTSPEIPYAPWAAPVSEWPVTIWPAFEAVKCAERQSSMLADDLAWAIRIAFFSENRCISMRHVLIELAAGSGLDAPQFEQDFDSGVCKLMTVAEARAGWETLRVPGSPSWVFSDGSINSDFGLPEIDLNDRGRPMLAGKPGLSQDERTQVMRTMLDNLAKC